MSVKDVPLYMPTDIQVRGNSAVENPFFAELSGSLSGPLGETITVPGFYNGNDTWVIRFSPTRLGEWNCKVSSSHIDVGGASEIIRCIENPNDKVHGGLNVHPEFPHHFAFQDGTPYFLMGYECDWLWALSLIDESGKKLQEFVDIIKQYYFNHVILNVYAHDTSWAPGITAEDDYGPPPMFAWEGTNDQPDHSRLNIEFFKRFDRVIDELYREGIVAHIFFKVYNKQVTWPDRYSAEENLYLRYVVARYQAYPNMVWDFSKECYYETDKEYMRDCILQIRALDGYGRLITAHDDRVYYNDDRYADTVDFVTAQQHEDLYSQALLARKSRDWPYVNSEFGYEIGPRGEGGFLTWTGHTGEELIERAYEVVIAGGYPVYYYDYTAWDIIDYSYTPPGYAYFKILYELMTSIEWWNLEPLPHICCASGIRCLGQPGKLYLVYCAREDARLDLSHLDGRAISCSWMNIYTGEWIEGARARPEPHPLASQLSVFTRPFESQRGLLKIVVTG